MKKKQEKKDKSIIRRRLWNGSIIAALVAALTVFGVMLQMEKNMLTNYERGKVYVAAKEIPKGQVLSKENFELYLEECFLDESFIPKTAVIEETQIEELLAMETIEEGVLLTTGMFEKLDEITAKMNEPVVAGVKAEDLYQMVGGTLRTGDRIHIYSVTEEGTELVWENVFVQAVFDQAGTIISNEDNSTAVQRMNVYLDKNEVQRFYSELTAGTLRVVKVWD